ncbi:MAG: molecular chaperone HtpG [Nevskiaceae bacterium]|nr:MAG: molecular chaperone HtpG [Nevskiaceae bacterium]TBR71867.1 MAG: molecular chaperone HtpG [Nevskiaceae bacterium]
MNAQADTAAGPQTHEFQAETKQLLRLMAHSLYSNKEIFLRELISNASDAVDKLRFEAITHPEWLGTAVLSVDLVPDPDAGTLTLRDNGIGMSREEVIENLGTIAHSGTKKFLESLPETDRGAREQIGQFGVGFYSAFVVADEVEVVTRRAGTDTAVRWVSSGEGGYTLEDAARDAPGTDVILHLRSEEKEFLDATRLRHLVQRYSDHIGVPVRLCLRGNEPDTLNRAAAFWTRPKTELKDEDYQQFYTHLTHDHEAPLAWAHHRVEGTLEYTSLLYIPAVAPFDLWDRDQKHGVQLYVKRVFVMDRAAELLPNYLRFVRGLVDSADLPLNVSRELLQGNRAVEKIRAALVKRVLDLLDTLAKDKPDDYEKFWSLFGTVFKEGIVEDATNKERIAKLCRFTTSTHSDKPVTGLDDYVARMPAEQKGIYYLNADSVTTALASPHLEGYRAHHYEVLLLGDRIDEWFVMHLPEYAGKPLVSCESGAADLAPVVETAEQTRLEGDFKDVLERLPKTLLGRVSAARLSKRLTESPACLVSSDDGMSRHLERILRDAGQTQLGKVESVLELNGSHPLVKRLLDAKDAAFVDLAEVLYGQAVLAEGGQLEDSAGFVKHLNALILGTSTAAAPSILLPD